MHSAAFPLPSNAMPYVATTRSVYKTDRSFLCHPLPCNPYLHSPVRFLSAATHCATVLSTRSVYKTDRSFLCIPFRSPPLHCASLFTCTLPPSALLSTRSVYKTDRSFLCVSLLHGSLFSSAMQPSILRRSATTRSVYKTDRSFLCHPLRHTAFHSSLVRSVAVHYGPIRYGPMPCVIHGSSGSRSFPSYPLQCPAFCCSPLHAPCHPLRSNPIPNSRLHREPKLSMRSLALHPPSSALCRFTAHSVTLLLVAKFTAPPGAEAFYAIPPLALHSFTLPSSPIRC